MRIIDADALGIGKAKPEVFENPAYADGWNSAIEIINNAPTLTLDDIIPHGRWIYHVDDLFPNESTMECSHCHGEELLTLINDEYCPACGAKMDLEVLNETNNL